MLIKRSSKTKQNKQQDGRVTRKVFASLSCWSRIHAREMFFCAEYHLKGSVWIFSKGKSWLFAGR